MRLQGRKALPKVRTQTSRLRQPTNKCWCSQKHAISRRRRRALFLFQSAVLMSLGHQEQIWHQATGQLHLLTAALRFSRLISRMHLLPAKELLKVHPTSLQILASCRIVFPRSTTRPTPLRRSSRAVAPSGIRMRPCPAVRKRYEHSRQHLCPYRQFDTWTQSRHIPTIVHHLPTPGTRSSVGSRLHLN